MYIITEVQSLTHACTNAQLPKACYYRSAKHNPCLHQRTNTKSTLLQQCKAQPVLALVYQDVHPQALVAWYTALSIGHLLRLRRTLQMTGLTYQNRERKLKKRIPSLV